MEDQDLRRLAGKIVTDKRRTARRFRTAYGWPVLIALARHYLDAAPTGESHNLAEVDVAAIRARGGDVERTAGGIAATFGVDPTMIDASEARSFTTKPAAEPAPTSAPDVPAADVGNSSALANDRPATISQAEGVKRELTEAEKRAASIAESISDAQLKTLRAMIAGAASDPQPSVVAALRRKELIGGPVVDDNGVTILGHMVDRLTVGKLKP